MKPSFKPSVKDERVITKLVRAPQCPTRLPTVPATAPKPEELRKLFVKQPIRIALRRDRNNEAHVDTYTVFARDTRRLLDFLRADNLSDDDAVLTYSHSDEDEGNGHIVEVECLVHYVAANVLRKEVSWIAADLNILESLYFDVIGEFNDEDEAARYVDQVIRNTVGDLGKSVIRFGTSVNFNVRDANIETSFGHYERFDISLEDFEDIVVYAIEDSGELTPVFKRKPTATTNSAKE